LYKVGSGKLSSDDLGLIVGREYQQSRSSLKYPSLQFRSLIHSIIIYINERLSIECHRPSINKLLVDGIINTFDIATIHCSNYNQIFQQRIVSVIVKLFINHWCTENRILSGKRQMQSNKKKIILKYLQMNGIQNTKRRQFLVASSIRYECMMFYVLFNLFCLVMLFV